MAVGVGDFVRITAKMKLMGVDDVMNVYTYRVDRNDTADDTDFMDDAAKLLDIAYTLLLEDINDRLTFVSVDGQNISKSELLPEVPWPILVDGDNAGSLLPTQCAAEVFWPTTTPKVRTTTFLGGYSVTANDAVGQVATAARARVLAFAQTLTEWNTVDVDAVKGSFNPIKVLFTQAGEPVVPARWRTQRRRRIGVGS